MNEMDRFPPTSSRRGSEDIINPYRHRTHEETSFGGDISDITPLIKRLSDSVNDSVNEIKRKFLNADTSKFTSKIDEFGRVIVRLIRDKGKYHLLFNSDGEVKEKLPKTIIKALGKTAEEIAEANKEEMKGHEKKISELKEARKTAAPDQLENIVRKINEQQEQVDELERENEEIEERMSLRDKIKTIFKKCGFTITAVISAVTVVISVLVSNLKKGLTTLGKKLGGGLKDVGKKLGQILPGLVGAIASFIFKTAGEAIGFLAKNAWLLIVAVVVYFAEKIKNRK